MATLLVDQLNAEHRYAIDLQYTRLGHTALSSNFSSSSTGRSLGVALVVVVFVPYLLSHCKSFKLCKLLVKTTWKCCNRITIKHKCFNVQIGVLCSTNAFLYIYKCPAKLACLSLHVYLAPVRACVCVCGYESVSCFCICVRLSVSPLVRSLCVCVMRKAKEKDMLQTAAEKYLFFYLKMCVSVCVLLKA